MKLTPEPHDKGREDESKSRRSSFARARSQLTQAVGDVLSGLDSKKPGGWLTAFATPATATTPHADRLREVVIRDRALFAANPRPRRTLREEEEEEAANAAAAHAEAQAEADDESELTIVAASPLVEAAKAAAERAADEEAGPAEAEAHAVDAVGETAPAAPVAAEDPAVQALAAAIDAAAREERVPEEPEEAPAAQAAAVEAALPTTEPEVASAPAVAEATPLEQLAAKATKVKSKAGAREGGRPPKREPIRTRTMARLLASQGHRTRALSIYDELLAKDASDASLREEAEALRNQAE